MIVWILFINVYFINPSGPFIYIWCTLRLGWQWLWAWPQWLGLQHLRGAVPEPPQLPHQTQAQSGAGGGGGVLSLRTQKVEEQNNWQCKHLPVIRYLFYLDIYLFTCLTSFLFTFSLTYNKIDLYSICTVVTNIYFLKPNIIYDNYIT